TNGARFIVTSSVQFTEESLDNAANFMYALSIDEIQSNLMEPGIELVLPDQYLTTDALKTAYQQLTLNESGGSKLLKGITKVATFGGVKYQKDKVGAPEGYREFINLSTAAKSIMSAEGRMALANLCFNAGLDAFVVPVIYTEQNTLQAIEFNYYVLNPLMEHENPTRKELKNYKPIHSLYTHYMANINLPWNTTSKVYAEELKELIGIVGIVSGYQFKTFYIK
ncbi:MAG: hypothetical protein AAF598_02350, partial [Bacteroidota bacterium]